MSLDEYEAEARARSEGLEALGKLPHGYTRQCYPLTLSEQIEERRLSHALQAAADVDTFVALARGESVHPTRLRPEHARTLKRR